MAEVHGTLDAPVLAKILAVLEKIAENDARLRKGQSLNAPLASLMGNGTTINGQLDNSGASATLTDTAIVRIPEADSGETFYQLVFALQDTSGRSRYSITGTPPKSGAVGAAAGVPVPGGGGFIVITGHQNIKRFAIIAEAGQSGNYMYQLFK